MVNKAPAIQIEKDGENPWFNMVHGLVLETAVCRVSIRNLKNLLIKAGLTTEEEVTALYDDSLKTKVPQEFERIEQLMGFNNVKLSVLDNGDFYISGQ